MDQSRSPKDVPNWRGDGHWAGRNAQKKTELERVGREGGVREGGVDKAVFNEKGMCILRIFMTI